MTSIDGNAEEKAARRNELVSLMLSNASVKTLVNAVENLVGEPLSLQDFMHESIAISSGYPNDDVKERKRKPKTTDADSYRAEVDWIHDAVMDGAPHVVEWPGLSRRRMYCGCLYGQRVLAFIRVVDANGRLGEVNQGDVAFSARVLGAALSLKGYPYSVRGERWPSFLWNLLTNDGRDLKESFIDQPVFENIRRFRTYWLEGPGAFNIAKGGLPNKHWYPIAFEEGAVCLADDKDVTGRGIASMLAGTKVQAGASEAFGDVKDFRITYRHARFARQMATRLGRGEKTVASYEDYVLLDLAEETVRKPEEMLPGPIAKMLSHDAEKGTAFALTALVYLECGGDTAMTASQLHLHRNTVLYRVARIHELFGLDLADPYASAATLIYLLALDSNGMLRRTTDGG